MTRDLVPFVKMHGLGNDYIYLDAREVEIPHLDSRSASDPSGTSDSPSNWAPILADRHRGIGGDGVIVLRRHPQHPCRMEMFNADGSRAEMCGNEEYFLY